MIKILISTLFLFSFSTFGQNNIRLSNKTLKDSIFVAGDIIKIPTIIYSCQNPAIRPVTKDSIKLVADFLNKFSKIKIEIGCHSDSRGNEEKNVTLTFNRATEVYECLIKDFKIDKNRITYKGYGDKNLIYSDQSILKAKTKQEKEYLHSLNRRTEIKIISVE